MASARPSRRERPVRSLDPHPSIHALSILEESFPGPSPRHSADVDALLEAGLLVEGPAGTGAGLARSGADGQEEPTETTGPLRGRTSGGNAAPPWLAFADRGTRRLARARLVGLPDAHRRAALAWQAVVGVSMHCCGSSPRSPDREVPADARRCAPPRAAARQPREVDRWLQLRELHPGQDDDFLSAYARMYADFELRPGVVRRIEIKAPSDAAHPRQRTAAGGRPAAHARGASRRPGTSAGTGTHLVAAAGSSPPGSRPAGCAGSSSAAAGRRRAGCRQRPPGRPGPRTHRRTDQRPAALRTAEVNAATTLSAALIYATGSTTQRLNITPRSDVMRQGGPGAKARCLSTPRLRAASTGGRTGGAAELGSGSQLRSLGIGTFVRNLRPDPGEGGVGRRAGRPVVGLTLLDGYDDGQASARKAARGGLVCCARGREPVRRRLRSPAFLGDTVASMAWVPPSTHGSLRCAVAVAHGAPRRPSARPPPAPVTLARLAAAGASPPPRRWTVRRSSSTVSRARRGCFTRRDGRSHCSLDSSMQRARGAPDPEVMPLLRRARDCNGCTFIWARCISTPSADRCGGRTSARCSGGCDHAARSGIVLYGFLAREDGW